MLDLEAVRHLLDIIRREPLAIDLELLFWVIDLLVKENRRLRSALERTMER